MAASNRLCPRCGGALAPVSGQPGRWACKPCGLGFSVRGRTADGPAAAPPAAGDGGLRMALLVGAGLAAALLSLGAVVVLIVFLAGRAAAPAKPVAAGPLAPTPTPVAETPVAHAPGSPRPDSGPTPPSDPRPDLEPAPTPPAAPDVKPTPPPAPPVPAADPAVNKAIDKGVAYLKRAVGGVRLGPQTQWASECQGTGLFSLVGLALLESGVPATDPAVARAVESVRAGAADTDNTYEIATCLWFLNRLDDRRDDDLMRTLATRLLAGQTAYGSWRYTCPTVGPAQQKQLLAVLEAFPPSRAISADKQMIPACGYRRGMSLDLEMAESEPVNLLTILAGGAPPPRIGDPSLTQFAVLGLWVARKHQVPVDRALLMAEAYARVMQEDEGGWGYQHGQIAPTDAMTCAGLMDLAVGRGVGETEAGKGRAADAQFEKGIWYLSDIYDRGAAPPPPAAAPKEPVAGDPYATLQPLANALLGHAQQGQRVLWKKDLAAFEADLARELAAGPPADAQKDMQEMTDQIKRYHDAPVDKATREKAALVKRIQQSPAGRAPLPGMGMAVPPAVFNFGFPTGRVNFLKPNRDLATNVDDIYALWSLERLAMVCDLKTLGGRDWYAWGSELLVAQQQEDGQWAGQLPEPVDTCLALLFLKRVNVAPDLTVQLQRTAPVQDLTTDQLHYTSAGQFRQAGPPKP